MHLNRIISSSNQLTSFNKPFITVIFLTAFLSAKTNQVEADIVITSRQSQAIIDVWASPPLDRYRIVDSTTDLIGSFVMDESYTAVADNAIAFGELNLLESVANTGNQLTISSDLEMQGESMWVDASRANSSTYFYSSIVFEVTGEPVDFRITGTHSQVDSTADLIRLRGGVDIVRIDTSQAFDISGTLQPGTYTFLSTFSGAENTNGPGFIGGNSFVLTIGNLPVPVVPESLLVTRGNYNSGGVAEIAASDDADLSLQRAVADIQSRTEFQVSAVSPVASPSSLAVTLEGSVFARSQVEQTIELFDYTAGAWEQVDTRPASRFVDDTVTVAATGDLSRFVEPGTQVIEARIRYQSGNPRQQFASNIDQFNWTIGQ